MGVSSELISQTKPRKASELVKILRNQPLLGLTSRPLVY